MEAPRGVFNPHNTITTLLLAYTAIKHEKCTPTIIAEPGAGTATISLIYAKICRPHTIIITDIDPKAIQTAKKNTEKNKQAHITHPAQCNWLDCIRPNTIQTALLNPPYLPCHEKIAPQLCCNPDCNKLAEAIKSTIKTAKTIIYTTSTHTPIKTPGKTINTTTLWKEKIHVKTITHNH